MCIKVQKQTKNHNSRTNQAMFRHQVKDYVHTVEKWKTIYLLSSTQIFILVIQEGVMSSLHNQVPIVQSLVNCHINFWKILVVQIVLLGISSISWNQVEIKINSMYALNFLFHKITLWGFIRFCIFFLHNISLIKDASYMSRLISYHTK